MFELFLFIIVAAILVDYFLQLNFIDLYFERGLVFSQETIGTGRLELNRLRSYYQELELSPKYRFKRIGKDSIAYRLNFTTLIFFRFFPIFRGRIVLSDSIRIIRYVNISSIVLCFYLFILMFINMFLVIFLVLYAALYLYIEFKMYRRLKNAIMQDLSKSNE
jgi:hypothetical protein